MKTDYISTLIHRYFKNDYPSDMKGKLQTWLTEEDKAAMKEQALLQLWSELKVGNDEKTYTSLKEIKKKLGMSVRTKQLHLQKIMIAATLLLCICGGGWYYFYLNQAQWITITTAYGEQKVCILPDSSSVYLNAGSLLRYPQTFKGSSRQVYLSGEGWFSVTKDKQRPFTVQTSSFSVRVLGTQFNLSDYKESTRAVIQLESGKVSISLPNKKKYTLTPNQQLSIDKSNHKASISSITAEASEWKNGKLLFDNVPLNDILQALRRHYNISFVYQDYQSSTDSYSVKFTHNETVEEALDILKELTGNFNWTQHNNQIILQSWHN